MATATAAARELHLNWCRWFHCESSFSLSLAPDDPGLFAVAREESDPHKHLTVLRVEATDNVFHALNQLFAAGCPLRAELEQGRCFLRYAVVPDAADRQAAAAALQYWLAAPDAPRSALVEDFLANAADHPFRSKGD